MKKEVVLIFHLLRFFLLPPHPRRRERYQTFTMFPKMVVLDLDACLWDPEVYLLQGNPDKKIMGDLGNGTEGVVGATDGDQTVKLHPGAFLALRTLREMPDVKVAAASTSLNPTYSRTALDLLEIEPGVNVASCIHFSQIGRTGHLTKRKDKHIEGIHAESGIAYTDMLFFDDCNWGDHVTDLNQTYGVIGYKTPTGLKVDDWHAGLKHYAAEKAKQS